MTKLIKCEDCPCLNNDYENGSWCNLDYNTDYRRYKGSKVWKNPGWATVSSNCKLVCVVAKNSSFIPETIDEKMFIEKGKEHE